MGSQASAVASSFAGTSVQQAGNANNSSTEAVAEMLIISGAETLVIRDAHLPSPPQPALQILLLYLHHQPLQLPPRIPPPHPHTHPPPLLPPSVHHLRRPPVL